MHPTALRRRPLDLREVLRWADAYREIEDRWPTQYSGPIPGTRGETGSGVNSALRDGGRGLPGGSSLADLLAKERGARHRLRLPDLSEDLVLAHADAFFRRTGAWPTLASGPVPDSGGERWSAIDTALR